MTDAEVQWYKEYPSQAAAVKDRKKAFDRVYQILILEEYLEWTRKKYGDVKVDPKMQQDRRVTRFLDTYPFNTGAFRDVSMSVLTSIFVYERYTQFFAETGCAMCQEYDISDILGITYSKYVSLSKTFTNYVIGENK